MNSATRNSKTRTLALLVAIAFCLPSLVLAAAWKPAQGPLMTRWAKDVSPKKVHLEYPRPQMVREQWLNLNGLWDFAIATKAEAQPSDFPNRILVPFPIESALSGVMTSLGPENRLWYRRTFTLPKDWRNRQILLHFGAVDWETTVYVNGKEVGSHRGGYDAFSFNITSALTDPKEQELVVAVWDPTDAGTQPRGKQIRKPHGIWYTPTSGIWQTVWLEPVAEISLDGSILVPDIDANTLNITAQVRGDASGVTVQAVALDGQRQVAQATGKPGELFKLTILDPKLWWPDSPFLYNLKLSLTKDGQTLDEVTGYFGMRKTVVAKDGYGVPRLMLNNQPVFQFGPLDQGFWPDGLYTAPTDEALRYDIEMTKALGFNMARKHVKIEPERWYYWCDKLGLLVWQDMPSGDKYIRRTEPDIQRTEESAKQFELELKGLIDGRRNHPCIVMWVPFNEGWGQYDTARITDWIKNYDPSRVVNSASGWTDRGTGDVNDIHSYPGPAVPKIETGRAIVLGEFGGLGLPVSKHTWQDEKNWGYRSYKNSEELTTAYLGLIKKLWPMTGDPGLSAAIYTQTTDVEIEVNGLMTYDRALVKMDQLAITAANKKLYLPAPPPPAMQPLSPASKEQGVEWRYTTTPPSVFWLKPDFDDSAWQRGPGGFGTANTLGSKVRTEWKTSDIWLRRAFEVPADFKARSLQLLIHHDDDAEVYVNGKLVASFTRNVGAYELMPLDEKIKEALKPGKNTLAVHCQQTGGNQYIDVGLVNVLESEK